LRIITIFGNKKMRDELTFEDGIIICKHIYQNVIDKTLQGVFEQEEILIKLFRVFLSKKKFLLMLMNNFQNLKKILTMKD